MNYTDDLLLDYFLVSIISLLMKSGTPNIDNKYSGILCEIKQCGAKDGYVLKKWFRSSV